MNTLHKILSYWFPIFIYCLLIFIQSSYPAPEQIPDWSYFDKFLHVVCYALLGVLFLRAFQTTRIKQNVKLVITLSILCSSLYGMSDEFHQYFVPYRYADVRDVLADILGSVCGVYVYKLFIIKNSKI
ncbi:VanZ family protein [Thermodesulfobacteriota bacterium]